MGHWVIKATGKVTGFALVSIYSHLNLDVRLPGGDPPVMTNLMYQDDLSTQMLGSQYCCDGSFRHN